MLFPCSYGPSGLRDPFRVVVFALLYRGLRLYSGYSDALHPRLLLRFPFGEEEPTKRGADVGVEGAKKVHIACTRNRT